MGQTEKTFLLFLLIFCYGEGYSVRPSLTTGDVVNKVSSVVNGPYVYRAEEDSWKPILQDTNWAKLSGYRSNEVPSVSGAEKRNEDVVPKVTIDEVIRSVRHNTFNTLNDSPQVFKVKHYLTNPNLKRIENTEYITGNDEGAIAYATPLTLIKIDENNDESTINSDESETEINKATPMLLTMVKESNNDLSGENFGETENKMKVTIETVTPLMLKMIEQNVGYSSTEKYEVTEQNMGVKMEEIPLITTKRKGYAGNRGEVKNKMYVKTENVTPLLLSRNNQISEIFSSGASDEDLEKKIDSENVTPLLLPKINKNTNDFTTENYPHDVKEIYATKKNEVQLQSTKKINETESSSTENYGIIKIRNNLTGKNNDISHLISKIKPFLAYFKAANQSQSVISRNTTDIGSENKTQGDNTLQEIHNSQQNSSHTNQTTDEMNFKIQPDKVYRYQHGNSKQMIFYDPKGVTDGFFSFIYQIYNCVSRHWSRGMMQSFKCLASRAGSGEYSQRKDSYAYNNNYGPRKLDGEAYDGETYYGDDDNEDDDELEKKSGDEYDTIIESIISEEYDDDDDDDDDDEKVLKENGGDLKSPNYIRGEKYDMQGFGKFKKKKKLKKLKKLWPLLLLAKMKIFGMFALLAALAKKAWFASVLSLIFSSIGLLLKLTSHNQHRSHDVEAKVVFAKPYHTHHGWDRVNYDNNEQIASLKEQEIQGTDGMTPNYVHANIEQDYGQQNGEEENFEQHNGQQHLGQQYFGQHNTQPYYGQQNTQQYYGQHNGEQLYGNEEEPQYKQARKFYM